MHFSSKKLSPKTFVVLGLSVGISVVPYSITNACAKSQQACVGWREDQVGLILLIRVVDLVLGTVGGKEGFSGDVYLGINCCLVPCTQTLVRSI